jgi:hypothetical protein
MAAANWTLSDDRRTATVAFPTSPPVTLNVSAGLIEDMVKDLGELRSEMEPEVPDTFTADEEPVADPVWEIAADQSGGDAVLLHIRDPRFGWLHYAIPREEARKLAGYLQELL